MRISPHFSSSRWSRKAFEELLREISCLNLYALLARFFLSNILFQISFMRRGDYKWFSQGLKLSQKLCLCVRKRRHTIHGCTQQMHCCIIRTFIFVRYLMHFFSLYYRQWVRRVHFLLSAGWSKSYRINPIRRIENFATAPLISHFFLRHFNFLSCTSIVLF